MNGAYTYQEITSQADAWEEALNAFGTLVPQVTAAWEKARPGRILVTGCGSTLYLSQSAARLLQAATSIPATAVPASELLLFTDEVVTDPANTLLLAISRSGTTSETIEAVNRFRSRQGGMVWAITCYPDSPLARSASLVLPTVAARELSVAQTRSFTSMLVLAQALAAHLGRSQWSDMTALPDMCRRLIEQTEPLMMQIAGRQDLRRLVFLGSGAHYGVANEAMLKMMEMSLISSQAFHFMEFRHGPMSMVGPDTLMVGLLSGAGYAHEVKVLREMMALGATTLALNPTGNDSGATWEISLPAAMRAAGRPALYLPPLQLLAYYRSLAGGLDPDSPRHLTAVIELDAATLNET